jgi:hypothetical protein
MKQKNKMEQIDLPLGVPSSDKPAGRPSTSSSSAYTGASYFTAPSHSLGRKHNIVEKDYFRMMKTQRQVKESIRKKSNSNKPAVSILKFKSRSDLLVEEY